MESYEKNKMNRGKFFITLGLSTFALSIFKFLPFKNFFFGNRINNKISVNVNSLAVKRQSMGKKNG